MQVFLFQVYATHLGQYTNNPNAYIMFYEREKPIVNENSLSLKIVSTHSISPSSLSNGCANGSGAPRTNGFFKRENSFSSSMNHYSRYECGSLLIFKAQNIDSVFELPEIREATAVFLMVMFANEHIPRLGPVQSTTRGSFIQLHWGTLRYYSYPVMFCWLGM